MLVVLVFSRDLRSTLVPAAALVVSVVATFGCMYLCGYTLDNLSLMALAISTGFVVDDAIVVMGNIARLMELGGTPFEAAVTSARETSPTVLSISLSLIAVFVPIFFMGGIAGRLFHEFAGVLILSIAVSMVVSLTMTPMMCAYLLKAGSDHIRGRLYYATEHLFDRILAGYRHTLASALRHPVLVLFCFFASIAANGMLIGKVKKGFFPLQDTGSLIGGIQGPQDASFRAMQTYLQQAEAVIQSDPAVEAVTGYTGVSSGPGSDNGSNSCFLFVSLKPIAKRKVTASQVIDRLRPRLDGVAGAVTSLKPIQEFPSSGKKSNASYQYAFSPTQPQNWQPGHSAMRPPWPTSHSSATSR